MSGSTSRLVSIGVLALLMLLSLLVLAGAPLLQIWLAHKYMDADCLKAYASSQPVQFYQFALTALGFLAVVAGYLTYRSKEDAKKEGYEQAIAQADVFNKGAKEELKKLSDDLKKATEEAKGTSQRMGDDFKSQAAAEIKVKGDELQNYADDLRKAMAEELERLRKAISEEEDRLRKTAGEGVDRLQKAAAEKLVQIQGIQLPVIGETAEDRRARNAFNNGVRQYEAGRLNEAIALWREAIRLKPDSSEARNNLGIALGKKGDYEDAIAEFRKAIRRKPDFAITHYNLAWPLALQGKITEAATSLLRAIELDPQCLDMARNDPDFDVIRNAPEIVEILGTPPYGKDEGPTVPALAPK